MPELIRALDRVTDIRHLGITSALARVANTAKVNVMRRLLEARRLTPLVAFASILEAAALDDALDLLDLLITEMFSEAAHARDKARLRTMKDLDAAAIQMMQVSRLILDPTLQDAALRSAIFQTLDREALEAAVNQVDVLVRPPDDVYYQELAGQYARVRKFLPHLLRIVPFEGTPAGQPVLEAMHYLQQGERDPRRMPCHAIPGDGETRMASVRGNGPSGRPHSVCVLLHGAGPGDPPAPRSVHCTQYAVLGCAPGTPQRVCGGGGASDRVSFLGALLIHPGDDPCPQPGA